MPSSLDRLRKVAAFHPVSGLSDVPAGAAEQISGEAEAVAAMEGAVANLQSMRDLLREVEGQVCFHHLLCHVSESCETRVCLMHLHRTLLAMVAASGRHAHAAAAGIRPAPGGRWSPASSLACEPHNARRHCSKAGQTLNASGKEACAQGGP